MITKPRPRVKRRPQKPEPKVYRRRRCQLPSCYQLYRPIRANQRFCSKEHKVEFHFKTESFQRTRREVIQLVEGLLEQKPVIERIARRVFLELETAPPPALVDRMAARIADMICTGALRPPLFAVPSPSPRSFGRNPESE